MPITPTEHIWLDGELVPWGEAKVHLLTHSLHYGSGVFEGIRAYRTPQGPGIFRLTDHVGRLQASCRVFLIDLPFSGARIAQAIRETVRVNRVDECYIRPLVFLGYGEMGLNPLPCPVHVAVAVWPWGTYLGEEGLAHGIRAKVSSWRRFDPNTVPPSAKGTGMYINSQLAKVEAIKAGYDEAILLNPQGYVSECSGENLFVVRGRRLLVPPPSAGALQGITQDTVVTMAKDLGYEVATEHLMRSDLYTADEAFLTGTAAEVVPIASVDDRPVGDGKPGPVTLELQAAYFAAVRGENERYKDWVDLVDPA